MKGLKLFKFLDSQQVPPKFLSPEDNLANKFNQDFLNHEQQDQLLVVWILVAILAKMVGLSIASQIWEKLHVYFASQTRAKVKKLKIQLRTPKKDRLVNLYLLEIKKIVDTLSAIDSPISTDDHIEAILDGMPEDYDGFVTVVLSRTDPYTVEEIEVLLLSQEKRFDKHKSVEQIHLQANLTSGPWISHNNQNQKNKFPPLSA